MTLTDFLTKTTPLPDTCYRLAIRWRLKRVQRKNIQYYSQKTLINYADMLSTLPLATDTNQANTQHYEVPTPFFTTVLGPYKKYSSCLWSPQTKTLSEAEHAMLELTCKRADIQNGQTILELGCGWGSFTLYAADRYPDSHITAISNSRTQKQYIEAEAKKRNLTNITVITENITTLNLTTSFDRIVSIELLEHIQNYDTLFERLYSWLHPTGSIFIHIFGHKNHAYLFDASKKESWMAKYFFSGGQMPAKGLFSLFNKHLSIQKQWTVNGVHYYKTCMAWLNNMDTHKETLFPIFLDHYQSDAKQYWRYWRLFFLACAELFRFNKGNEWQVYHYVLERR